MKPFCKRPRLTECRFGRDPDRARVDLTRDAAQVGFGMGPPGCHRTSGRRVSLDEGDLVCPRRPCEIGDGALALEVAEPQMMKWVAEDLTSVQEKT